ncbi:hypothetical protein PWEIH_16698 [Listeria weihenstephanensis FSL R9-0317]|uniref:HD/PDEase domain-containing protein n=1 Tax=Listeria weihenstephanensis TaxID=1006155 RepID=A0A1S7FW58_9LIST|nr:HD domain-containing protein [Listeria weihenstephanensis]AQY51597.1 hypothetical protein UE46_11515 [Listeria weihenstephanensis]EUJ34881.1 hypothetical protein PWEIH_16698 [Listeria weihenstephanensis FSL R9-0317]
MDNLVFERAEEFIKKEFINEKTGHDWHHIERVYKMAHYLQKYEGGNLEIIKLAALFHDYTDKKLKDDPKCAELKMKAWFKLNGVTQIDIEAILVIIQNVSFSSKESSHSNLSLEGKIVQDADRLDAIGAIGIARCFTYGGAKGRYIYNPKDQKSTSIQHFYDKLLKIKDKIQTDTAKEIAVQRHEMLLFFLRELEDECNIQF